MNFTTLEELEEALSDVLGSGYRVDEDIHGQIVVHTGLRVDDNGELEVYVDEDDLEEDPDLDPEIDSVEDLDLDGDS
jgi:hypothetical protein